MEEEFGTKFCNLQRLGSFSLHLIFNKNILTMKFTCN